MARSVKAYVVHDSKSDPKPGTIVRRELLDDDVALDIEYCGICHSDLHQARNDWNSSRYPMVPGHEIIGKVSAVGSRVTKFKKGDTVGVGCLVDSCGSCDECKENQEQFCRKGFSGTYNSENSKDPKGQPTFGGYSQEIVVNEKFVLNVPESLYSPGAAPLLCAGITVYSPLAKAGAGPGKKVAVVGLGGLGASAIKIAKAMGSEVTLISRSHAKDNEAKFAGAKSIVASSSEDEMKSVTKTFDIVIDTVPNKHDFTPYLGVVRPNGNYIVVGYIGAIENPGLNTSQLIFNNTSFTGSLIGGIKETQEMLDFCAKHKITLEHELISFDYISKAYERLGHGDIKYRFVLDLKTI